MKPDEYNRLTYREYQLMSDGYHNRRSRDFEHTRLICYTFASAFRDPKKRMPAIEQFMSLPTDDKGNEIDDLMATRQRLKEHYLKTFGKVIN